MRVLEKGKIAERECRNVLKSRKEMWTGFGVMYLSILTSIFIMIIPRNWRSVLV